MGVTMLYLSIQKGMEGGVSLMMMLFQDALKQKLSNTILVDRRYALD